MEKIIVEFPKGEYVNEDALENVIAYILRLNKMELVGGHGCYVTNPWDMAYQFSKVQQFYSKDGGKQVIHMVVTIDQYLLSAIEVKELAYMILEYFGGNRQIVFAVHDDKRNLHIHFAINPVAFTNREYCAFFDQREIKKYAEKCIDVLIDRRWFGKEREINLDNTQSVGL